MARLQILPLPNPTGDIPGAQPFALVLDQVQKDLPPEQREQLANDAETFRYRCAAAAILVTTQSIDIPTGPTEPPPSDPRMVTDHLPFELQPSRNQDTTGG
ncbi:hypothetical protein HHL19_16575 [Streptomyces sp. R302]|uniref:hypothetical protein n=1 Tax=unclassified Streptomyces TaxID=2593676 RepID=UPI00145E898F|nr:MULTISPECIES: hypothetical protein [unclassified Streptomyces]NML55385.1 hypothetical protein [Streptomyces sp. R301]NML80257.1 hypothetical protein [Streptomyces sp. R302]